MLKKWGKYLFVAYLLALPIAVLYIKNILRQDNVKVMVKAEELFAEDTKPVSVVFVVEEGKYKGNYQAEMTNKDKVSDLLIKLRREKIIYFETVYYLDSIEFRLDDQAAPNMGMYRIFLNDIDITDDITSTRLSDGSIYTLKLLVP